MTNSTAVAEAPNRQAGDAGSDWVLRLFTDPAGRVSAAGAAFAARGPLRAFVAGILHDRGELARRAHLSGTPSDAELVVTAYEREGDELFPRLRGSFVAAIVDSRRNLATVARDPVGLHPLFYTTGGGTLAVSSSQHALLGLPGVSRRLNRVVMADQLCQRWTRVEDTYFEEIKRVPGGCRVVYDHRGLRIERYWNRFDGPVDFLSEAEADRFDEQLSRAVGRCFGDGRVGIFLSGGLDSVSIAAMAADHARAAATPPPLALSLAFPHAECNEESVQRSVGAKLGLPHELIGFLHAAGPRGLFAEGLELQKTLPGPLFNIWMPAYQTLSALGFENGVRTIVTGEGGDEWLTVSPFVAADLIRRGDVAGLTRMARTWHRSFESSWYWVVRGTLWRFGLRPLIGSGLSRVLGARWDGNRARRRVQADPPWVGPDPEIRAEQHRRALERIVDARPAGGFYARELRAFLSDPVMPQFFEEQFEAGRRVGVRYQHPYWDPDLVDHMYRTPPEVLTRGNRTKGLVRRAVARRFPDLGFESQRKVLAFSFFTERARIELKTIVPRYVSFPALSQLGIVEPSGAAQFVEAAFDQGKRSSSLAWRLILLEDWARQYGKAS